MDFFAYHDSHNLLFRDPFGAVTCGQTINFRLLISSAIPVENCFLRLWESDSERLIPMKPKTGEGLEQAVREEIFQGAVGCAALEIPENGVIFEVEYDAPNNPGLVWYYFKISLGGQNLYYGNNVNKLGGVGSLDEEEPPSYQVTVHNTMEIPMWYQRGMMYQIFVDRFYHAQEKGFFLYPRKNALLHADWYDTPFYIKDEQGRVTHWDFFGGNLLGVIKKLPYLQELGISIIYFNPIFDAPSNHKYDTADYHRIDPMFGDEELFEHLIKEAKRYGIAIVLDGVFSHTGSDSVYFNRYGTYPGLGAYQSCQSPYYEWYQFKPDSKEYKAWWNVDALPEVDELNPSYQEFLLDLEHGVIPKWMKKGAAGWRLDVADELPDEFIRKLRQTIKAIDPEAVLIGEVWEDASNKYSYGKLREYFWGYELDAVMNYPFRDIFLGFFLGVSSSNLVHQQVMSLYENYPRENFYAAMNLIGSHDRERILTLLGEAPHEKRLPDSQKQTFRLSSEARKLAVKRLKLFSLLQMTFPGVPCVYYGDEVGLEGYSDPYNRGTYPWGREDKELLEWYQKVIRWRQEYEVLQSGDFQSVYIGPDIYGFRRFARDEEIIVLVNRHPALTKELNLQPMAGDNLKMSPLVLDLLSGKSIKGQIGDISLDPLSAQVLYCGQSFACFPRQDFVRSCGVLMHISSLPSDFGLGDMGDEAYRFIDFLAESGQSLWQVLPLNPVGLGDSPYQSDSAFAGNLRLINLDYMVREELLPANYIPKITTKSLSAKDFKETALRRAFKTFRPIIEEQAANGQSPKSMYISRDNYLKFQKENREWLHDYALFRAFKVHFGGAPWYDWEDQIALRKNGELTGYSRRFEEEVEFNYFIQYTFYHQWHELRKYANSKGIKLIGDLPFFVAADSCDVWVNRQLFRLDKGGRAAKVAGVPPDYFSEKGQLWGNPVYDWAALAADNYAWWKKRIKFALESFDYLRLDHFRGFEAYWEIDAAEETAIHGRWVKGSGKRLFESLSAEFGQLPFLAEDLGVITPEVNTLKQIFGFPGMKVLQFTPIDEVDFDEEPNTVYYSGTHDNDTLVGWYKDVYAQDKEEPHEACQKLLEALYMSSVSWVITPMQDLLGLDTEARMNVPGTIEGNWQWQLHKEMLTKDVKDWLRAITTAAKRLPKN